MVFEVRDRVKLSKLGLDTIYPTSNGRLRKYRRKASFKEFTVIGYGRFPYTTWVHSINWKPSSSTTYADEFLELI